MTYSFTQISQYLACPRRYRHRYLDGWREKENRASLRFGRAFEQALAAYFLEKDPTEVFFQEWQACQGMPLEYGKGDTWERMYRQGVQLLERLAQDNRIGIERPRQNLQIKLTRPLKNGAEFVAFIDAIGFLGQIRSVIEWKTTTSRYAEEPEGLLALDPQLICYSWMSGIENVAVVAFVRRRIPEIQYLRTQISEEQRQEFGQLVEETMARVEAGQFLPRTGIRFPQNGCTSCSFLGLCLQNQPLIDTKLLRRLGGDLGWLDELEF